MPNAALLSERRHANLAESDGFRENSFPKVQFLSNLTISVISIPPGTVSLGLWDW